MVRQAHHEDYPDVLTLSLSKGEDEERSSRFVPRQTRDEALMLRRAQHEDYPDILTLSLSKGEDEFECTDVASCRACRCIRRLNENLVLSLPEDASTTRRPLDFER